MESIMQPFEIVALYFAVFALMNIVFLLRIVKIRRQKQVSLGDGGENELRTRIRTHGNFVETIIFSLAALIILALLNAPSWLLHLIGLLTIFGRLSHAYGMIGKHNVGMGRPVGMVVFILTLLITIIYILYALIT